MRRFAQLKGLSDFADLDLGVLDAVSFFLAETFAALLLVGNHFITLHMVQNFGLHFYAYCAANRHVAIGIGQEYISEFYFIASVATYMGHVQSLVFLHLKLLAGYFYYCEHNGSKIRTAKVVRNILLTKECGGNFRFRISVWDF